MASPTIVVVPGACQPPSLYAPFSKALEGHSIPSIVVPTPSVGAYPGLKDFSEDVALIRKTVSKLIDEDKDVIVLMHSYGGIPGSAALKGLGKSTEESQKKKNGVVRLVYVCSFALREGEQMPDADNIEQLRKYASEGLDEDAGTLLPTPAAAAYMSFHDVPEKEAQHWASLLEPHSLGAMWSKQSYAAWKDIPSTYLVCNQDRVIPVERQEGMIKNAREVQPKAFDVVERLECGHQPILSKIEELVKIVEKAANTGGTW